MKTPTVYLAACDNYLHALKATQFLFEKFWPTAKVVVLGYTQPPFVLNKNWSFIIRHRSRSIRLVECVN